MKDKSGNDYTTGTKSNREWAEWARNQGYDSVIVRNVRDYYENNHSMTEPGTVIMTYDSAKFKSAWNTGKLGKKNEDIRYNKAGTFKLTGQPVSQAIKAILDKLAIGQKVTAEEINSTPEVQWAKEHQMQGESVPFRKQQYTREEMQQLVSAERFAKQQEVQDDLMALGSYSGVDKNGNPVYDGNVANGKRLDVVIGPPAAGKSSALVNPLSRKYQSRVIDNDMVKEQFDEYQGGLNSGYLHSESRYIMDQMLAKSMSAGENVVLPVVGHSINSLRNNIGDFRDAGYQVYVHYVELDNMKAIGRMLNRFLTDGRYIDPDYLINTATNEKVTANYEALKGDKYNVDGYSHWSNDVNRGESPRSIEQSEDFLGDLVGGAGNTSGIPYEGSGTLPSGTSGQGSTGQLAATPGRDDGRGDYGAPEQYARQGEAGRGTQSQAGYYGQNQSGIPARLLSKKSRQNLNKQSVTDLHLQVENDQQRFSSALSDAKATNSHGAYVDAQSTDELNAKGAVMIISPDGLAGAAVATKGRDKGNIFGVFKNAKSTAKKASAELIIQAIAQGGNKLDCYDGDLSVMYSKVGMIPVARVAFNEEFMPDDWNVERDDHPDIVFWMHNGDSADTVAQKYGLPESKGGYHVPTLSEIKALPLFDDAVDANGETEYGYDRAWDYRDKLLARRGSTQAYKGNGSLPGNTTNTPKGAPKNSPQRIAKDLVKKLGIGQAIGTRKMNNMPRDVQGYYQSRANYIAVRNRQAGNYVVNMHEIGHAIAHRIGMTGTQDMVNNLDPVFAANYSAAQLPGEAFAEFMWRYMADETAGRAFAGDNFVDDFERRMQEAGIAKDVHNAANELRAWINASTNEQIGATKRSYSDTEKIGWREQIRILVDSVVDATNAAEAVNNMIRQQSGSRSIPLNQDIRKNALMKNFSNRRAFSILTKYLTDAQGTRIGESLADVFERTGLNAKNEDLFWNWELARHSMDRDAQNKPVFDAHITPAQRQQFITDTLTEHPEFLEIEKGFQQWRKDFLQAFLVDTGYLSQEAFDRMNAMYPSYVPTQRVKDKRVNRGSRSGKTYQVRRATGSTEDIYHPLETFVEMVDSIVTTKITKPWAAAAGQGSAPAARRAWRKSTKACMVGTIQRILAILQNGSVRRFGTQ